MKKIILFVSLAFSINAMAQFTVLKTFSGVSNGDGDDPHGSLMQATDGMLYGMTSSGGVAGSSVGEASGLGILFQYNTATNTYTKKIDFDGTTNGSFPKGSLIQATDGMLYGMTSSGGVNNSGTLFQYNPATIVITKKLDLVVGNLATDPPHSLMQATDGMLYGMTYSGGANNLGTLFQYNPATSTYTNKIDFDGTMNGSNPSEALMQGTDGMLYGMTVKGGANDQGVLFQYNPATNVYTKKFDFGSTEGSQPLGSLMQTTDGMLYGMTRYGGSGYGALFQYNPATNVYTKKFNFSNTQGTQPWGSLMQATDGMLYGMTMSGGSGYGALFQYNPATNLYAKKFDFAGTNGYQPLGSLMQGSDGMLYGMTSSGGQQGNGLLFKYNIGTAGINQLITKNNSISIYPNPTTNIINIDLTDYTARNGCIVKVINTLGQVMFTDNIIQQKYYVNLSTWAGNGIYFVQIIDGQGNTIDIKKIVLQ